MKLDEVLENLGKKIRLVMDKIFHCFFTGSQTVRVNGAQTELCPMTQNPSGIYFLPEADGQHGLQEVFDVGVDVVADGPGQHADAGEDGRIHRGLLALPTGEEDRI